MLAADAPADIDEFEIVERADDLDVVATTFPREEVEAGMRYEKEAEALRPAIQRSVVAHENEDTALFEAGRKPEFYWKPYLRQSIGGPDNAYLYDLMLTFNAEYWFAEGWKTTGALSASLFNNMDQFKYNAPSGLPRVRTNIREYYTATDVGLQELNLARFDQWGNNWFTSLYGGWFEMMYGGVGGEILYRPLESRFAVGLDVNAVRQRAFEQNLEFQDYKTVTGHATLYWQTPVEGVYASLAVGRYLAKDNGATLVLSRQFNNGMEVGAWATRTDVSAEEFGEGSFDKGFYFRMPLDLFATRSSTQKALISFRPLIRDGGQMVARPAYLYGTTQAREYQYFDKHFDEVMD